MPRYRRKSSIETPDEVARCLFPSVLPITATVMDQPRDFDQLPSITRITP